MRPRFAPLLVAAAIAASPAAHAAPASAASVETLFQLMHTRENMDVALDAMRDSLRHSFAQLNQGRTLAPAQQAAVDRSLARTTELMRQELTWDKLEPEFVQAYVQTFQQDEMDALIAFYRSPAGQAFATRMPELTQKTMQLTRAHMAALMPQIQQIARETRAQLQAAEPAASAP